jgi:hypothetical protein
MKLFKPKRPSYNDIKKYEGAFCGGKNSNKSAFYGGKNRFEGVFYGGKNRFEGVFYGGNTDSIQENTSEDVGATPTSSTIEKQPFPAPPIRHGIRKIIE